jgi:hypothetical protein
LTGGKRESLFNAKTAERRGAGAVGLVATLDSSRLFARNGQSSLGRPPKTDAQIVATALPVYLTNQTLAGSTAAA